MEDVLMNFLLSILEGGGPVEAHPLIQQLLDLMWLLMEVSYWSSFTLKERDPSSFLQRNSLTQYLLSY